MGRDTLSANESLSKGDRLDSADGKKRLVFQDDGHVCLYYEDFFVWGSGTNGTAATRMTMQADGNLCIYDSNNHCLWSTGTNHHDGESLRLTLQNDGNLCIYGNVFIWGTMTYNVRRFRRIRFINSGRTAFDSYPLVKDAKTGNTIWNGRDNSGFYWCIRNGETKEVDFGGDLDQNGQRLDHRVNTGPSRAVNLGLEIVAGDNVWYNKCTFVYDPDCTRKYDIYKLGGLRDGVESSSISMSQDGGMFDGHWGDFPAPWDYEKATDCFMRPSLTGPHP